MVTVIDKQRCCGCGACVQSCPKHCIVMVEDHEGFLYPRVDVSACVDCGFCEKVCPFLSPYSEAGRQDVLAMINKDETVRCESSSGGVFTHIATSVLNDGGVVFGARFDDDWQVVLDYTESVDGLAAFRGSKYVQASSERTYSECEFFLKQGRRVLFTGSPCQIAGLHHFLRRKYDNLITCDFVCHGVPSPKVWRMYLNEIVPVGNKAVRDIRFRKKDHGWKRFNFRLSYDKDNDIVVMSAHHRKNHFMRAFLSNIILRPSCYNCKAKQGASLSDITIGDFWGIQNHHPEMDDDRGTSLVLINTEKGRAMIDWSNVVCLKTDYEIAAYDNAGLKSFVKKPIKRDVFFHDLDGCNSVVDLIERCTKPSLYKRLKAKLKKNGGGKMRVDESLFNWVETEAACRCVSDITFRDKRYGWKEYSIRIELM